MSRERTGHRIVLASRLFEPEPGAAAYRLGALRRSLERAGDRVTVLTSRVPGGSAPIPGVQRWPVLRDASGTVRGYLQFASFDGPLFFRLLFSPKADLVIAEPPPTTGMVTRWIAAIRRIPYAYYSADVATAAVRAMNGPGFVLRIVHALERAVLSRAEVVLAVTAGVRDEVIALGADPDRTVMVGTGVDTRIFNQDGPGRDGEQPYLVYAGTMSEFQGAGVFVEAFARIADRHPAARLLMFGGGVEFDAVRERAVELSPRIELRGTVPAAEAAEWIRGARAGLASVKPGEYDFAFPTKALASVACGTPVVFAGAGPLRDLVSTENLGWAVDWDVEAVAGALDAALSAPEPDRSRLAAWAQATYSLDAVADRVRAALHEAIERRAARGRRQPM